MTETIHLTIMYIRLSTIPTTCCQCVKLPFFVVLVYHLIVFLSVLLHHDKVCINVLFFVLFLTICKAGILYCLFSQSPSFFLVLVSISCQLCFPTFDHFITFHLVSTIYLLLPSLFYTLSPSSLVLLNEVMQSCR